MIHESLFSSEVLSELPIEVRYLYIATIVHADDAGRMRADAKYLKLKAFPFDPVRSEDILAWRDKLATNQHLIEVYVVDGREYLFHPKWDKWQTLRKDRMKPTDCPDPATKCQPDVNQVSTKCPPKEVKEVNRTEPNRREGKGGKEVYAREASALGASPRALPALTKVEEDDMPEFDHEDFVKAGWMNSEKPSTEFDLAYFDRAMTNVERVQSKMREKFYAQKKHWN